MRRQQTILVAVLVVLLGLLAIQRWQRSKIVVSKPAETVKIEPDKVTRVAIHNKSQGDVDLARSGADWKVTKPFDYAASADLVQGMLKSLEDLKLEDVISSNPEKRGTYQVDSTGTAVDIYTGGDKPVLSLVVGKSSADWTHTFVRRTSGNEVYRAEGVLAYNFNRRPEDWRDKSILKLDEAAVKKITLDYSKDKQLVTLVRPDSVWSVSENGDAGEPVDSLAVARLVANAAKLNTVNFATPEEAAGKDFAQPDLRLLVEAGGMTSTVDFVNVDETKVLAKKQGSETVFSLYKSNLTNLMKKADELRKNKRNPPAAAASVVPPAMKGKQPAPPPAAAKGKVPPTAKKKG